MVKRMASMNTRLNIKKLDGNIVQKHGGSKQVRFKQLGPEVYKQCMKSGVAKHLGVAGIQQQNGLVDETNVALFAKASAMRTLFLIVTALEAEALELKRASLALTFHQLTPPTY
nr:hypothetical protein [Tanacetum cinerariifolium]